MEQRELGRTGHRSTLVTFGTAGLGRVEQDVADKAIEAVLEHGVNHIHIAPSYGEAMECLAPWMPQIRDQDDIDRAMWWSLSQPVHTAPSAGDVNLLPRVLAAAERFVSLSVEEQD
ncbi:MAG: hypothetical protein OTJ97_02395 [SAR202 cluster bacterium]|nr:hypothetical protein [SAR202 cluster bacterium]